MFSCSHDAMSIFAHQYKSGCRAFCFIGSKDGLGENGNKFTRVCYRTISLRNRIAYNHSPTSGLDGDLDISGKSWKVVDSDQLTTARVPRRTAASYGTKIQISLAPVTTTLGLASSGWSRFCTTPYASHGLSVAGAAGLP
jgi:hypothetical protein